MSRSIVHDLKNNFGQGLTTAHTSFSGSVSLAAPSAGFHLRVFKVAVDGPVGLGNAVEVQMNDDNGNSLHVFPVAAQGHAEIDLGSRFLRFDSAIGFTRATAQEDQVFVTVFYTEHVN